MSAHSSLGPFNKDNWCTATLSRMGEASGAFTGLEKTGTLLKLNKGARAWAYSDVKPKTVHLRDGVLTYSGGGSLGRGGGRGTSTSAVELRHVAQLRQSTVPGAPVGAFDLQMQSKPSRTYTFAPEPGASAQGWLGALAVAVPDSAVDRGLQAPSSRAASTSPRSS